MIDNWAPFAPLLAARKAFEQILAENTLDVIPCNGEDVQQGAARFTFVAIEGNCCFVLLSVLWSSRRLIDRSERELLTCIDCRGASLPFRGLRFWCKV
jgi:hypothetical protein